MNLDKAKLFTKTVMNNGQEVVVYYDPRYPDDEDSWIPVRYLLTLLIGNRIKDKEGRDVQVEGFSQWIQAKGYPQIADIWNNFSIVPVYEWNKVKEVNEHGQLFVIERPNTAATWHGYIFLNPNFIVNTLFRGLNYYGKEAPSDEERKKHPLPAGQYYTTKEKFEAEGIEWTKQTGKLCVYYVILHEIFHNIHGDIFDWEQLNGNGKKDDVYNDHDVANIAMDFYCNWNVEYFFPEMKGFGKALGLCSEDIKPEYAGFGTSGWMNNYDELVRMQKEEEEKKQQEQEQKEDEDDKSDEYKEGYEDMCETIRNLVDSEFEDVSDKDAIIQRIVDEYRDSFVKAGIDIDDIINGVLNESEYEFKGGDYNEGSIDAFKDWIRYIKQKAKEEQEKKERQSKESQEQQDGDQGDQSQQGQNVENGDQGNEGQDGQDGDNGDGGQDGDGNGDGDGQGQDGNGDGDGNQPGDGNGNGDSNQPGEGGQGNGEGNGEGEGDNPGQGNGKNGKPSSSDKPGGQGTGNGQEGKLGDNGNPGDNPGNNGRDDVRGQKSDKPSEGDYTEYNKYYRQGWDEVINGSIQ